MFSETRLAALLFLAWLACAQTRESNPYSTEKEIAEGKRLYGFFCVFCHGMDGASGRGARLASTFRRHGTSDRDQFRVIANGISGTEMSGHWLEEDEIWKILAFVRTLERSVTAAASGCDATPGNAARGKSLFLGKGGCLNCHSASIDGRSQGRGRQGPDLTYMGSTRTRDHLRQSLIEPGKAIAQQYRLGRVLAKSGETYRGLILNEDEYTIHLMDAREQIRSLSKADLRLLEKPPQSLMPSYGTLFTAGELDDLLSFMCGALRGGNR